MNEREYKELEEASWRRKLTPAEESELQSYLANHPKQRESWDENAALTQLLQDLPDAPVASNFTSQVMQAVDQDLRQQEHKTAAGGWLSRLRIPRLGWAAMVVAAGLLALQFYKNDADAQLQVMVEALPPEPGVVLADFDAIRIPVVDMDEELWVALSQ